MYTNISKHTYVFNKYFVNNMKKMAKITQQIAINKK